MVSAFKERVSEIVKSDSVESMREFSLLKRLKIFSSHLGFGCHSGETCNQGFACCQDCARTAAERLKYIKRGDLEQYTWRYSEKHGFLDVDTGCTLPHHLRPAICLLFLCDEAKNNLDPEYADGLKAMAEIMADLEEVVKRTKIRGD